MAVAGVSDFSVDPCFDGCADGPSGIDGTSGTDTSTGFDTSTGSDTSTDSPVIVDGGADAADAADAAPPSPGMTDLTLSGTGVAVGKTGVVILTTKNAAGVQVARLGASVVFTQSGGTGVVTFSAVVDNGNGTYRATFTGVTAGTKIAVSATLDGAPLTTAPAGLRVVNPVATNLRISLDAANADGANNFGGKNCAAAGLATWTDLGANAFPGALTSFLDPCAATSGWAGLGTPENPHRLSFDGIDDHVNFGAVGSIQRQTVLVWIRKTGDGTPSATTGGGGVLNVVPIVAKGTNEAENDNVDINYYLALDATNHLVSEYESPANHPLTGPTVVTANVWHMVGLSLDFVGGTRAIYLDGVADVTAVPTIAPSPGTLSRLVVGGSRTSTGGATGQGAFQGDIAAVLTYNRALTIAEIESSCHSFSSRFGMKNCANP